MIETIKIHRYLHSLQREVESGEPLDVFSQETLRVMLTDLLACHFLGRGRERSDGLEEKKNEQEEKSQTRSEKFFFSFFLFRFVSVFVLFFTSMPPGPPPSRP